METNIDNTSDNKKKWEIPTITIENINETEIMHIVTDFFHAS